MVAFVLAILLIVIQTGRSIEKIASLQVGEKSPSNIYVQSDRQVEYEDKEASDKIKEAKKTQSPVYFNINGTLSTGILTRMTQAFSFIESKLANNTAVIPTDPEFVRDAYSQIVENTDLWAMLSRDKKDGWRAKTEEQLDYLLKHGIVPSRSGLPGEHEIKLGNEGRYNMEVRRLRDYPDCETAAKTFTSQLLASEDNSLADCLNSFFAKLIGTDGNVTKDERRTAEEQNRRMEEVQPVRGKMNPGELIIKHGAKVTRVVKSKLTADYETLETTNSNVAMWPWPRPRLIYIISLLLVMLATLAGLLFLHDRIHVKSSWVLVCGIASMASLLLNYALGNYLLDFCAMKIGVDTRDCVTLVLPMAMPFVLLSLLCGFRAALCCGFFTTAVTSLMFVRPDYQLYVLCLSMISGGLCAGLVRREHNSFRFYFGTFALVCLSSVISSYAFVGAMMSRDLGAMFRLLVVAAGNALLCTHVVIGMVYFLQWIFNIPTASYLQLLNSESHQIFQTMEEHCRGTLEHSRNVRAIARSAAKAIGADEDLVGACALVHDIGKLGADGSGKAAVYFMENDPQGSEKRHETMNAEESASRIKNHIGDGVTLAEKYHMCEEIKNGIRQHHGDDLVFAFYQKAIRREFDRLKKERMIDQLDAEEEKELLKEAKACVKEGDFRYDGKPPETKELVILSLADACEAAISSLRSNQQPIGREDVENKVDEIFNHRLNNGQLRNASVTCAELYKIRESFINGLLDKFKFRMDVYSGQDEQTSSKLAK